ncbi:MAG TPA: SulP family inorganic anion transporter, partial [Gemmatimonadaceae bacterium]|nr:SulP family inorganic anion transporter [Gemmatimonadaceae bacterium]
MPVSVLAIFRNLAGTPSADMQAHAREFGLAETWKADLPASLVVFLVAVPLCLGIALASGAPLFSGIIAGIVGGLVVGSLSQSQLMVSGPAAGLTAIVVSAIATLGSFRAFLVAVVLAGVFQIIFGLLGAGVIGYVFPMAVIKGMLAAIGIILILKQIPHAVGYDADYQGDEAFRQANNENTFSSLAAAFERIHPGAVLLTVLALALLLLWDKSALRKVKLLPGPLAAVVIGTVLNEIFRAAAPAFHLSGDHLVQLPVARSVGEFVGLFVFPDWSVISSGAIWSVALTIGVVASLESLLSLSATNRIDPYRREPSTNRELVAQGVGNIASGLVGGLPVTGVIVRSAANVDAGARTKRSAILHGMHLLGAAATIPALLNRVPVAPLAAILLYTGFKLAHPRLLRHAWSQGIYQFIPFVVTVLAILLTDLLIGIGVGLAVGLTFILIENLRAPCFSIVSPHGSVLTRMRLNENVTFLNKATLATTLENMPPGSRLEIDGRACQRIDHDVLEL